MEWKRKPALAAAKLDPPHLHKGFSTMSPMKLVLSILLLTAMTLPLQSAEVTKKASGKMPNGTPIDLYTLKDGKIEIRIMNYGGIVQSILVPDRNGKVADIALGFDTPEEYVTTGNKPYFGAIVGRYANRIAHGRFELGGKTYQITLNDGDNMLHGGKVGFDKAVWQAKQIEDGVELSHVSADGDQGFPGKLTTVVRYTVKSNELKIEYTATTDKNTVLNLTNHSYFNLKGQGTGDVTNHQVEIDAGRYTPVNKDLIPTGQLAPVPGTPFDFQKPHVIGERINEDNEQLKLGWGYDHNFVLDGGGKYAEAAEVYEPTTGRVVQVWTDQPGVQFYTGNHLDGTVTGKGGKVYRKRDGLCLETQHFPDSPNHPNFPMTELKPGQTFHSVTVYKFSAR
jgi:aldose 1-epimerase